VIILQVKHSSIVSSTVEKTERERERVMPEPREDDDIALGLDEEETEDETYDTLEEKYAD
jgi:hypothetical protein